MATQATREMIDAAERRLDVVNPYLTDDDVIQRLIAAAKRGFNVGVVVSETSNNPYADAASSHHYRKLIDARASKCGTTRARWSTPRSWSPTIRSASGPSTSTPGRSIATSKWE